MAFLAFFAGFFAAWVLSKFLAKYHKSHLFVKEAAWFNEPIKADPVSFVTSFNVTFGMVCYDIEGIRFMFMVSFVPDDLLRHFV